MNFKIVVLILYWILIITGSSCAIYNFYKAKKYIKSIKDLKYKCEQKETEYRRLLVEYNELMDQAEFWQDKTIEVQNKLNQLTETKLLIDTNIKEIEAIQKQKIDSDLQLYKTNQENAIKEMIKQSEQDYNNYVNYLNKCKEEQDAEFILQKEQMTAALNECKAQLEEYQNKQHAINETMRKAEQETDELNFHRIQLSKEDKQDISFLLSIEDKFHNKEILHKLIWSQYLQKPFNDMIKRTFGTSIPKNVIYCIENGVTQKKYIGKTSGDVSKRWTEHIKASLDIGTIKKTKIHNALFGNWDAFYFYVIEVVENGSLGEREKYYISIFETNNYGYNERQGG